MSKTIITSSVSVDKVQHSIVPPIIMDGPDGPVTVKESHIDSAVITLSVIMVMPGAFDESKKEPLLKVVMDKLSEVEL